MNETRRLLEALAAARDRNHEVALATVVDIEGSSYRREGAKLLVSELGEHTGIISGGCLEGEVAAIAKTVLASGQAALRRFDMSEDELTGLGLGCGGTVAVWIEPLGLSEAHELWLAALARGEAVVRAFRLDDSSPEKTAAWLVMGRAGQTAGSLGDADLDRAVQTLARDSLDNGRGNSGLHTLRGAKVFIELSPAPPELLIFGAGRDAIPVADLAHKLGFVVTVVDPRAALLDEARFPQARRVVSHPSSYQEKLELSPGTFVLTMNHHLLRDREALRFALEAGLPYVGVLGPASRFEKLLDGLAEEGFTPGPAQLAVVHNPVGLAIGAEGPEAIAVSIMAEILTLQSGRATGQDLAVAGVRAD